MRIKRDDTVLVLTGKDKGKKGKILQASHRDEKVIVEGVNKMKKHMKSSQAGRAGERVELEFPIQASNVQLVCPKCSKATRVGYSLLEDGTKQRVCKQCSEVIS